MAYSNLPAVYQLGDDGKIGSAATDADRAAEIQLLPLSHGGSLAAGDLLVLIVYAATPAASPGFSLSDPEFGVGHLGWVLAGLNFGTAYGSMAVWTKAITEDNLVPPGGGHAVTVAGPPDKCGVILAYSGASGLDGPVVFSTGTGTTATTGVKTLTARQSALLTVFASDNGQSWVVDGGTDRQLARFAAVTSVFSNERVPGSAGDTDPVTATAPAAAAWMTATLALLPLTIPDPPGTGGAGSGPGIHFSPGAFQPLPVLEMNNLDVPAAPGDPTKPVVLDGFRIRWGRDRVTDQPEPATGSLSLWFTSRTRATSWAAADGLPGQLLELHWQGVLPGEDVATRERFFRGRINSLTVRAHDARNPDGSLTRGAVVDLTLSSVLNDLQNITPRAAWPEEAMSDRLGRIQPVVSPYVTVELRDYWADAHVEPIEATSQSSMLDHITALYDSCGADRMTYLPAENKLQPVLRRNYNGLRTLAQLHADPDGWAAGRSGQGSYIRTLDVWPAGLTSADANVPNYLDAAALQYDPAEDGLTLGPDQRITRVELTHPDSTATDPYTSRTVVAPVAGVNETTHGVRAATISSQLVWPTWADQAADELNALVRYEGQEFQLQPLIWSTRKTGGFETVDQVRLLLRGAETNDLIFLQRSVLPRFGIRPVFGIMGGEIGYSDGGWDISLTLAPVRPANVAQHPISWDEIGDPLTWQDDGRHPDGLHESVTWEDMKYVGRGLGATTTPADNGWDY